MSYTEVVGFLVRLLLGDACPEIVQSFHGAAVVGLARVAPGATADNQINRTPLTRAHRINGLTCQSSIEQRHHPTHRLYLNCDRCSGLAYAIKEPPPRRDGLSSFPEVRTRRGKPAPTLFGLTLHATLPWVPVVTPPTSEET